MADIALEGRPAYAAAERRGVRIRTGVGWTRMVVLLVLVTWLIPIKSYKLPVNLPFNLEIYRLTIIILLAAWLVAVSSGSAEARAGGRGRIVFVLAAGVTLSLLANLSTINAAGLQTQAVKSLSFFLSYLLAFVLVSSVLDRMDQIVKVLRVVAIGAAIVAGEALYESRMHVNLFDHLHSVLPFLVHFGRDNQNVNGGALRVRASAQHPIALGCALVMCVPIAVHLSTRAASVRRKRGWYLVASLILMGALATVSRTVILMLLAMLICAFVLYGRKLLRFWPLLIVLVAVTHVAAPGVVSHIFKRFNPNGGLVSQLDSRAGMRGSGRIADVGPGLTRWSSSPLLGHGLGTVASTGDSLAALPSSQTPTVPIIFDDQYMNSLVSIGLLGLLGVLAFIWGAVTRMVRTSRRTRGPDSALVGACAMAAAGFGAGMATFDAFTFVQATLMFFIIAALGLRARTLLEST
jgi:O-antigen ligase/polysaccharide polymerase Wzy-like membrane protein